MSDHDKRHVKGREVLDDTPVAIPVRFRRTDNLTERVKEIIRTQASIAAQSAGFETFEEADDFYVGDDYDPRSPHELSQEQELNGLDYIEETFERGNEGRLIEKKRAAPKGTGDVVAAVEQLGKAIADSLPGNKRDKRSSRGDDDGA